MVSSQVTDKKECFHFKVSQEVVKQFGNVCAGQTNPGEAQTKNTNVII